VTIYMVDLGELPEMNAIFSQYFSRRPAGTDDVPVRAPGR
jgi:hypothetical protein